MRVGAAIGDRHAGEDGGQSGSRPVYWALVDTTRAGMRAHNLTATADGGCTSSACPYIRTGHSLLLEVSLPPKR